MAKKKILGVVRGVQPRMSEINYYSYFQQTKVRFFGDKTTGWIVEDKVPSNVSFINLPLKPAFLFDPITAVLGPLHTHRSWQYNLGLEEHLKEVDAIEVTDLFYFYCGQCAKIAKKLNKKLISTVWETVPHHPSTYIPPYSFNVKAMVETGDLFIARSQKAAEYLYSIGVDKRKVKIIYVGIDLKSFYPTQNPNNKKIKILYVGQLVPSKGLNELLEAFQRLAKEFPNLELWICGRSQGEPLEKMVKKLSKNYPIVWQSNVPYQQVPEIYRKCHIYCQLSQDWKYLGILPGGNEWFSYSIMEAMASGLPIVATDVGGIPEEVGNDNILVKQKDSEAVYQVLKDLILNPRKREKITRANIKRARKFYDIARQARLAEQAILGLF